MTKNAFNDKLYLTYALKSEGHAELLMLSCNEDKSLLFSWAVAEKSPMQQGQDLPISVSVRIDDGQIFEETWGWSSQAKFIRPKDPIQFLSKLVGAQKVAIRENLTGSSSVFQIGGFDVVFSEVVSLCKS